MPLRSRAHPTYLGFVLHRLSGLLLALFLPLHFWALALAIEGEARLEGFLRWADNPWVKLAEGGLVVALAVHLAGGLRLLALELLGWRRPQKAMVAMGLAFGLLCGLLFALNVG